MLVTMISDRTGTPDLKIGMPDGKPDDGPEVSFYIP
jgi:hypothetical protein